MNDANSITLEAIGRVSTDVADDEVPRRRRDMVSTIRVFDDYAPGLLGIEAYSHLFVLFWMHRAPGGSPLTAHPRGDTALPRTGVFAARGRNHPNSIGLAVVELLSVDGARLTVRRLDAWDGTPVLDIKPYDDYDVFDDIRVPAWLRRRAMAARRDPE